MVRRSTNSEFITKSKLIHGQNRYGYDDVNYVNNKTKVTLLCNVCLKSFDTRPCDHTSKKTGCPKCSSSRSETAARRILEKLLKEPISPASPKMVPWLMGLYLDGYCESLKFAFEYQGYQHTIFPNRYHRTIEEFQNQVKNDTLKVKRCKDQGINLILIPYEFTYKNKKLMKKFIVRELKKINFL